MRTAPIIRRRAAFTLVELMVSAALIIFMMYILSTAFIAGLESFRTLKTAGDMQEKLRSAAAIIRSDLCRPHFFSNDTNRETLSSQRLDQEGWYPPDKGYFRIYQGAAGTNEFNEYVDPDERLAQHKRSTDHVLQFTVRLDGKRLNEFFAAIVDSPSTLSVTAFTTPPSGSEIAVNPPLPLSSFNSPDYNRPAIGGNYLTSVWAEVTYYLRPYDQRQFTGVPANNLPAGQFERFALYRRVKILVDDPVTGGGPNTYLKSDSAMIGWTAETFADLSAWRVGPNNSTAIVNRPQDITAPLRRSLVAFGSRANPTTDFAHQPIPMADRLRAPQSIPSDPDNQFSARASSDLLLADVLGFTVRALWDAPPRPLPGPDHLQPLEVGNRAGWPADRYSATSFNPDFPFDALPATGRNTALQSVRVFDTWSRQTLSTGPATYNYGGTDPNTSANSSNPWNGGHFTPGTVPNPSTNRSMPLRVRVRALQIELRLWDVKSRQTRQVTIIQDV